MSAYRSRLGFWLLVKLYQSCHFRQQDNARLTAHLALRHVPRGVLLRVSNESVAWRRGEVVVFDDSFEHEVRWLPEHELQDRLVLIVNFAHPALIDG